MANALAFLVTNTSGAPVTGAAAGMIVLARDVAGAVRSPPTVTELGEGVYQVQPTDADEASGTALLIDTGGNEPRRLTAACFLPDRSNQFFAFTVEDGFGALWTGAAPTVGSYRGKDGVTRTPPALVALASAYLFALIPTSADITAEVGFRVDGPAGSAQAFWSGDAEPLIAAVPVPPPVAVPGWVGIENALRAWVVSSTGLAQNAVIWAEQTGARPTASTFATLRLGALTPVGAVDDLVHNYSALRSPGLEVQMEVRSFRTCAVSVQFFSTSTTGDASARAMAQLAQSALYLPSIREALGLAGVSVFDPGQVQNVTTLLDARFENRAVFEVRCYVMLTASEFTTWIEHCTPTGTYS